MAAKKKTRKITNLSGPPSADVDPSAYDWLKDHCRTLVGTTEDVKWTAAHVFSIDAKMYAWFALDDDGYSFQCDEDDFDRLTERDGIIPAPYAARMGWVKVEHGTKLPRAEARKLLAKAHSIVSRKLTKKRQRELGLIE